MTSGLLSKRSRATAVFQRIDSGEEGADVAFGIADKALRAAGVKWTDLLDAYFDKQGHKDKAASDFASQFHNAFSASPFPGWAKPKPATAQYKPPNKRTIIQGLDIPDRISGTVKIVDRRQSKNGPMLIVMVESADHKSFGPLVVFNRDDIRRIENPRSQSFEGSVTRSKNPRHQPVFANLR